MLGNLSDLGIGRRDTMGDIIEQETNELISILNEKVDKAETIHSHGLFLNAANNVIWRVISGLKHSQTDPKVQSLTSAIRKSMDALDGRNLLSVLMMYSPRLCRLLRFSGLPSFIDRFDPLSVFILEAISQARPDKQGNYGDRFLSQMETNKSAGKTNSALFGKEGKKHLFGGFMDMIMAGMSGNR